jgi:hypothetical protein
LKIWRKKNKGSRRKISGEASDKKRRNKKKDEVTHPDIRFPLPNPCGRIQRSFGWVKHVVVSNLQTKRIRGRNFKNRKCRKSRRNWRRK